ncbi:MAG: relaxase/mobilization nuclease domain-containing protein [Proteobacteria bacterium]|nr:relaxase/mobilization nuclease domain-containing protein [Pseudomonadota bacterium]
MLAKKLLREDGPGSFENSIAYALHGTNNQSPYRGQVIAMKGVPTVDSAAAAMRIVAKGSRCKDPALHIVLSFGPENTGHNDPSVLRDCIKKTLQALEIYDHQHIAILHRDTQHAHLHIIVNRVKGGRAVSTAMDIAKLHTAALNINKERGWPLVVSKYTKKAVKEALNDNPAIKVAPQRTSGERLRAEADRFRKPSWAQAHHDEIHAVLKQADSVENFLKRLTKIGIGVKMSEKHQGIIFFDRDHPDDKNKGAKGSAIGLSLNALIALKKSEMKNREQFEAVERVCRSTKKVEIDNPERDEILEKRRQEYQRYRNEKKTLADYWLAPERRVRKIKKRFEKRPDAAELLRFITDLAAQWRTMFDKSVALAKRLHLERMNAMPVPRKRWKVAAVEAMAVTRPPEAVVVSETPVAAPSAPKRKPSPEQIRAWNLRKARKRGGRGD